MMYSPAILCRLLRFGCTGNFIGSTLRNLPPKGMMDQSVDREVEVFWFVTPCNVVVEAYAATIFRMVFYPNTTRYHNTEDLELILHRRETPEMSK